MEKYYLREDVRAVERVSDVYVPGWAKVLIDLYTSPLRYEVLHGVKGWTSVDYNARAGSFD